ncbi:Uma2 family endonuclease [Leptospira kanakyensis]|uniref:Uma2 family endonuclease n=1 Tax=Leptospira kanakyensis TaxID=2484968 RepID=UPI00223D169E|nr:Uma2 family endonuclease [Leptospira kanakyensis]MCW7470956.1 Uma2 family endonuclease [Leptospira kanakyensis]MCW7483127.1 Uma2 family endonuclease [Leptospira kanakyensis]
MDVAIPKSEFDLTQVLNGVSFVTPSPLGFHQQVLGKLFFQFQLHLQKENLGEIFTSPLDVVLESDVNVVQPDLIYIKKENMSIFHANGHIKSIPDLLVEIISPGSITRDTVEKFAIYEKYKVPEYWIVFPEQKVIEVFTLKAGKYSLFCSTENTDGEILSAVFPGWDLRIEQLYP